MSSSSGLYALVNLTGALVSSPSGLSMNVSSPLVSSSSGPSATGPLVNLSGPPMISPSALNVANALASSSSGPQQLVHIPLSLRLSSNLPSRNCSPLSNLLNLPVKSEIPWKTGKVRILTSAECVQALKDKERKKARGSRAESKSFRGKVAEEKPEERIIAP